MIGTRRQALPTVTRAAALAALLAAAFTTVAQPKLPDPFEKGTLKQALDRSKKEHRLLIVYIPNQKEPSRRSDERVWPNPAVRAWVDWHAVVYRLSYEGNTDLMRRLRVGVCDPPTSICFVRGKEFARLNGYQGPAYYLFFMDFTLQRAKLTDAIFGAVHDRKNPPPKPPVPPDPFHTVTDDNGPAVADPEPADPATGRPDVLERLQTARSLVTKGRLYEATGVYTWLWERAEQIDPAFGPARRGVIAGEIKQLCGERTGSRARFVEIRDSSGESLAWAGFDGMFQWFILNEIVGEDAESIQYLDSEINDPDNATMLPAADRMAYDIMTGRRHFTDPLELGDDPVGSVRALARIVADDHPQVRHPDDRKDLNEFLRTYMLNESCRLYAACLVRGREGDADHIAETLLAQRDDAAARRALVATALVAGQARPIHARWLREAAALGAASPILSAHLEQQLAPSHAAPTERAPAP